MGKKITQQTSTYTLLINWRDMLHNKHFTLQNAFQTYVVYCTSQFTGFFILTLQKSWQNNCLQLYCLFHLSKSIFIVEYSIKKMLPDKTRLFRVHKPFNKETNYLCLTYLTIAYKAQRCSIWTKDKFSYLQFMD